MMRRRPHRSALSDRVATGEWDVGAGLHGIPHGAMRRVESKLLLQDTPRLVFCLARWRCARSFLSRCSLAEERRLCEFARPMTCQQVDSVGRLSRIEHESEASDLQGLSLPQP